MTTEAPDRAAKVLAPVPSHRTQGRSLPRLPKLRMPYLGPVPFIVCVLVGGAAMATSPLWAPMVHLSPTMAFLALVVAGIVGCVARAGMVVRPDAE
jgi:hypothetical protein